MTQLQFKQLHDDIVRDLADKLLETNRDRYNVTRECLILRYGYDQFRDIQCEAFDLILSQSGPSYFDTPQNETSQKENLKISK